MHSFHIHINAPFHFISCSCFLHTKKKKQMPIFTFIYMRYVPTYTTIESFFFFVYPHILGGRDSGMVWLRSIYIYRYFTSVWCATPQVDKRFELLNYRLPDFLLALLWFSIRLVQYATHSHMKFYQKSE